MAKLRHPPTQPTRLVLNYRGRRFLSDVQEWRLVEFLLAEMLRVPASPAAVGPIIRALFPLTKWHRWRLHAAGPEDRLEFQRQLSLTECLVFLSPPPPRFEYVITLDGQTWRSQPVRGAFHDFYRRRLAIAQIADGRVPIALIFPPWPRFWSLWARRESHRAEILRQLMAGPQPLQGLPK